MTDRLWPHIAPAALEDWMRIYYFATDYDLGSSGTASFSMADLRTRFGVDLDGLEDLLLRDGKPYGSDTARQVLADRFTGGDPARVMTTSGSSEAMFLTISTLLAAGDEVVVVEPVYQQLVEIARSLSCRIVPWPLREPGFTPDIERLRSLVTGRTKMIVANFPHNPTGTTLTLDEYEALVGVASHAGAYLVWDAAFEDLTHGAPPLPHPDLLYERAVTFGTFSKNYGLSGVRFGWCLGAQPLLESYARIRDYITLHLSTVVEFVAYKVMLRADAIVADRKALATLNLGRLGDWVAGRDDVSCTLPRGGVSAAVRLDVDDVTAFCHRMATERRVLLVPGEVFGPQLRHHVRLGFGAETPDFTEGLHRLSAALDAIRPLNSVSAH